MTMGSGEELRLKLTIDTGQLADDLAAVDREIDRLQGRMMAAFNRSKLVRRGRVPRAQEFSEVHESDRLQAWTPEVRAIERQINARYAALERAARGGQTRPPLTPQQELRAAAQQRLSAAARPIEITAKQKFFDDMVTSLRRSAPNVAGMAAGQTGIPGASGLARMLMGLAGDNPLIAGGLGAAVAVGAGAIAIDAERARFQRTQASLASAMVGGPAFGDTRTMMGLGIMAAAQQMSASKEEGGAVAYQLASAGMRPGQTVRNMQTVLGVTGAYGLQTSDVAPLVAALGTAGGMNANQIKQTFSDIVDASGKATGSIQQLTQGLGALSAVNARAGRDAFGLAAIQRAVGPTSGINAGQLMAPTMGATGASALQAAAFLGMSPQEFVRDQATKGGMAKIYDRIAARSRDFGSDATGTLIAEQVLGPSGMNLLNLPADATKQAAQIRRLQTQQPGAADAAYQRSLRVPRPKGPSLVDLTRHNKGAWDNFQIAIGNLFTAAINSPGITPEQARARHILADMGAPRGTLAGPMVPHGAGAGGGKFGLHTLSPGLIGQVGAAAGDVSHNVKIDVTVKDQRGNQLGHAVDHKRVIAGSSGSLRPPYDHAGRGVPPAWSGGGSSGGHGGGGGSSGFD